MKSIEDRRYPTASEVIHRDSSWSATTFFPAGDIPHEITGCALTDLMQRSLFMFNSKTFLVALPRHQGIPSRNYAGLLKSCEIFAQQKP